MVKIDYSCDTHVGLRRHNNEDAFFSNPDQGIVTVVDGMGGVAFGEVASKIFKQTAEAVFLEAEKIPEHKTLESVKKLVIASFELANKNILNYAAKNPSHLGMGCTAELIAFHHRKFVLGHVGDSRTYLFRKGKLVQLTRDHSLIQDQIDLGFITKHAAKKSAYRNIVHRAVGVQEQFSLDVIEEECVREDVYLLCTDGLTDMVEDSKIEKVLSFRLKLHEKVEHLIKLANTEGGIDNITVALCEVLE